MHRADGVGMVLLNTSRGQATADFHSVPTVHLTKDDGRLLRAWLRAHPGRRVELRPDGVARSPERLVAWTSSGDPTGAFLKPDVVATAVGVLGATPPSRLGRRWDLGSGTSVAAARTSGIAAALLSRHDWSAAEVRSALATTAGNVAGDPSLLRLGAGRTRAQAADRPGLVFRLRRRRLPRLARRRRRRRPTSTPRRPCCGATAPSPGPSPTSAPGRCTTPRPPPASSATRCR